MLVPRHERLSVIRGAAALAVALAGCAPDHGARVQPGADDPSARRWTKAGVWYPTDPDALDDQVGTLLDAVEVDTVRTATAILTPHAGLSASGPTAAQAFARVEIPDKVIVLAPDHWGEGAPTAIWTGGPWLIPGHAIAIDHALVDELRAALPDLADDPVPFAHHEAEMQLPFLQYLRPDVEIAVVAITDNSRHDFDGFDPARIEAWGHALAGVLQSHRDAGDPILLVTTSDLVHHQSLELADSQGQAFLDHVAALDIQGLYDFVTGDGVTTCGEIVTAIMMATVAELGATSIDVVARGDDLHVFEDPADVIGYPAAVAWR